MALELITMKRKNMAYKKTAIENANKKLSPTNFEIED